MLRAWRGILCPEEVQTGDGRVFAAGSIEWADLPLPLAWLRDGDQHISLAEVAPQIGTITDIRREGNLILGEGFIDDENPDGAEVIRRMESGTAPMGVRFGISIDGDDYEIEIVATEPLGDEDEVILLASAGEGDPSDNGDGEVLGEMAADDIIERTIRMRIRGATLCAVPAFAEAYIELPPAEVPASDAEAPTEDEPVPVPEAALAAASAPVRPPEAWFEQPNLTQPTPMTVTREGRVFGHLACWDGCHTSFVPDSCLMPPRSAADYAYFLTGEIETREGTTRRVGQLTMGCGHADMSLGARSAAAHYDGGPGAVQVADVTIGEDEHGPWVAGALRPGLTDEQIREFRAQSLSGDWRRIGGNLELVAALAVPVPGFPIAVAASGSRDPLEFAARARLDAARKPLALVAAGRLVRPSLQDRVVALEAIVARYERVAPYLNGIAAAGMRREIVGDLPRQA